MAIIALCGSKMVFHTPQYMARSLKTVLRQNPFRYENEVAHIVHVPFVLEMNIVIANRTRL